MFISSSEFKARPDKEKEQVKAIPYIHEHMLLLYRSAAWIYSPVLMILQCFKFRMLVLVE